MTQSSENPQRIGIATIVLGTCDVNNDGSGRVQD